MQLSGSLFTHMIMDNKMARMSQEKMENTIYTTQPETIGISSEILHKHTCNCFYDKLVFYKWKCCWICANHLRAEATSLWEIDGKAINVTDTHKNCQTHTCLLWIYAGNHIQTLVLTNTTCLLHSTQTLMPVRTSSFFWRTEKENQRH